VSGDISDMLEKIKKSIQEKLHNKALNNYNNQVEILSGSYRHWYTESEGWKKQAFSHKKSCRVISMQALEKGFELDKNLPPVIIFADSRGQLEENTAGIFAEYFHKNVDVAMAYADEDEEKDGERKNPWFKPCWSPDTLESFQYFGHIFAVRTKILYTISEEEWQLILRDNFEENVYRLILLLCDKIRQYTERKAATNPPYEKITQNILFKHEKAYIGQIQKILLHMPCDMGDIDHRRLSEEDDAIRVAAAPKKKVTYKWAPDLLDEEKNNGIGVSIIIPSKDHPDVLELCISTLREKTYIEDINLEIIVVDNGSSGENREAYEKLGEKYAFYYHYTPMDFNFSKMCNMGAGIAKNDYLVFLNDDMEIIQGNWLKRLLSKAMQPHAGAVGAKLLYPESDLIQHVGVTNMAVGPVHKLHKLHDNEYLYHGQNRHVYDMLAVTGACLMVKRTAFDKAGGFDEELEVSYNDVDLCFSLYEAGFFNIQRNDVILYHHESLSRGDDNMSDEKWNRLLKEKALLYKKHPMLDHVDPFYNKNLAGHSILYVADHKYPYEARDYYTKVSRWKKPEPEQWTNGCLILNVEHARIERKLEISDPEDVFWVEGWSYVLGMDNCRYERKLLLTDSKGKRYLVSVLDRYRKDVLEILPDETNVALAGFTVRIPKGKLPAGEYSIAMIAKDRCSNQRLYAKSDMILKAGKTDGKENE